MNIDSLVSMANHIGEFFEAMPDRAEGLKGIADHIRRFWAPRMREQLTAHLEAGGAGLSPVVQQALTIRSALPTPTPFDARDPEEAERRHELDGASES